MTIQSAEVNSVTLPFDKFWGWLQVHCNCILRSGTPEVVLFDHEDFHWHLAAEDENVLLVQLIRGKELVSEIVVLPNEITYVQCESGDSEEFVFECVVETEAAREVAYHFVMAHGYDEVEPSRTSRWTH